MDEFNRQVHIDLIKQKKTTRASSERKSVSWRKEGIPGLIDKSPRRTSRVPSLFCSVAARQHVSMATGDGGMGEQSQGHPSFQSWESALG